MGRLKGCLWLTAGLLVAAIAGVVGFMALQNATAQTTAPGAAGAAGPQVGVVVAVNAVPVRGTVGAADVELRQMSVDAVPEGALARVEDAAGRIALTEIFPGEVLLTQRLVDPNLLTNDARFALLVDENAVLIAYPAGDLINRAGVLKPGDRVDLHFTMDVPRAVTGPLGAPVGDEEETVMTTFSSLQNAGIAAIVAGQQPFRAGQGTVPEAMLFAVTPQDALVLKYIKDAGGKLDVVLRAPGAEQPFDLEPVDLEYLIDRFRLIPE